MIHIMQPEHVLWDSLKSAAAFVGVAQQNISRCCRGKCCSCGGFKWKYKDEY